MEATKILLSAEELQLVQDTHWLLTKNKIVEKAKQLFGELAMHLQKEIEKKKHQLPDTLPLFSPKVFKGEYYHGLPYVMLDYPRIFSREDVFAIRTMFWWGNFFSVTLQLKGIYLARYADALLKNKQTLEAEGFHVAVSDDEWRHDFESDNYRLLKGSNGGNDKLLEEAVKRDFVKLAVRFPLSDWNRSAAVIAGSHGVLIGILTD